MNGKQTLNRRPSSTNTSFKAGKGLKENQICDSFQIDPKIAQLKKKYQLDKSQTSQTYFAHRPPAALRQQQVFKKLENIRSQLQSIPDWQNLARSILFKESNQLKSKPLFQPSKELPTFSSKYIFDAKRIEQESIEESKILDNSNISFKINHTKSIQKIDDRHLPYFHEAPSYTPVKTNSQFKVDKYRQFTKKQIDGFEDKNDKVDEKISEISRKIKQSQLKKKILGVEFVPFQKKSSQRKYQSPQYPQYQYEVEQNFKSKTPQYLNKKNSTSIQKLYTRAPKQSEGVSKFNQSYLNTRPIKEELEAYSPRFAPAPIATEKLFERFPAENKYTPYLQNNLNSQQEDDQYKMKKNRSYSVYEKGELNARFFEKSNQNESQADEKNKIFVQKAQEAIKERRKKVDSVAQKKRSKQNTQKLVQAFCQQVKLDQKFRNCKLWFKANKNEKKVERLKSILECEGLRLNESKINEQFNVEEKEDNPFFSVTSQNFDIEEVARSYIECEKNWKKNLYRKFNKNALEHEDFNSLSIDLDKKGYIVLEDLVRWLNMETGTFFRNRDLFTIFKRMSSNNEKLNFNTFINNFYA